jgi:carboxylesterase type B
MSAKRRGAGKISSPRTLWHLLQRGTFALRPNRQRGVGRTVRAGQPTWWYRFSYVAQSTRDKWKGTLDGFENPNAFNIPAAHVGDKVTDADKAMGVLASGYWVAFGRTGDDRPEWPRHAPSADRVISFTTTE